MLILSLKIRLHAQFGIYSTSMKKPIQISIPQPCHEKWADMTPADKGRFCTSCQKTVIDFTRSSDREIAKALRSDKHLCGRFMPLQLDRDLVILKEKSSLWAAASAAVLTFLTMGSNEASAQTVKTEQTDSKTDDIKAKNNTDSWILNGIVSDETGPLPGASITNLTTKESAQSNMKGEYQIKVRPGDRISFEFIGYTTQIIMVNKQTTVCNIILKESEDVPVVKDVYGQVR